MATGVHCWSALILIGVIFVVGAFCIAETGEGKIISVDDGGGANFTRVQDAIDAASDGDTIRIFSGTYHEEIRVNKSVCLEGNGSGETILDGSGFPTVIVMDAKGACISNCTIRIVSNGSQGKTDGIFVGKEPVSITNNLIEGYKGNGITLGRSKGCKIRGNVIRGKSFSTGIYFFNADGTIIEENRISDTKKGIDGSSSENIEIRENSFTNCTTGIELLDAQDFLVEDNSFAEYSKGISIHVGDKRDVVLKDNTFDGSGTNIKYWEYETCTGGHGAVSSGFILGLWIVPIGGVLAMKKVFSKKRMKPSDSFAYHYVFIIGWTAFCLWLYFYTW